MMKMDDKCVTIRCSIEAAKRLRELEFVYEDADGDFSIVSPFAGFAWKEGETVGVFKLSPSFLECLCNGGHFAYDPSIEHTLFTKAENEEDK